LCAEHGQRRQVQPGVGGRRAGTHAFYEAINHAGNRALYGRTVTDFPHVRRLFTDVYPRLVAMKLVTARAGDYMRTATREDRRYPLHNALVKARVTSEGEKVVTDLWDVIAAKGMQKDTFFEAAARDIRWLPRLEGTVHVNTTLMVKFMPNYLFAPDESMPAIGVADEPVNDDFLFDQGPIGGLGTSRSATTGRCLTASPPYPVSWRSGNRWTCSWRWSPVPRPARSSRTTLTPPSRSGSCSHCWSTPAWLEAVPAWGVADELLDEIFGVFVRDFNGYATDLLGKASTTTEQADLARGVLRQPAVDPARSGRVWEKHVLVHKDAYEMSP
jgi:acyl-CoA dehydrogenase